MGEREDDMNSFLIMMAIVIFTVNFTTIDEESEEVSENVTVMTPVSESVNEHVGQPEIEVAEAVEAVEEILFADRGVGPVEYSFFDEALFVGDSIMNQLSAYVNRVRTTQFDYMSLARFGGVGNYGINNALSTVTATSTHHVYQGVTMNTPDYIAKRNEESPVSTVYLWMGMNDFNIFREADATVEAYSRLIDSILEKNPHVEIVLMGVTPVADVFMQKSSRHNPEFITKFNIFLQTLCVEKGYGYIDFYSLLCDENGMLPADLSSGDGFHLTDKGYGMVIDILQQKAGNAFNGLNYIYYVDGYQDLRVYEEPEMEEVWVEEYESQELDELQDLDESEESEENQDWSELDWFYSTLEQYQLGLPEDMADLHESFLLEGYGVDVTSVFQTVGKQTSSYGIGVVDTLIFLEVASLEQGDEIVSVWKATLEGLMNQNKLYDQVAYEIYRKAEIVQEGLYLGLMISEDATGIARVYRDFLSGNLVI